MTANRRHKHHARQRAAEENLPPLFRVPAGFPSVPMTARDGECRVQVQTSRVSARKATWRDPAHLHYESALARIHVR
jgi:hypothetical protein